MRGKCSKRLLSLTLSLLLTFLCVCPSSVVAADDDVTTHTETQAEQLEQDEEQTEQPQESSDSAVSDEDIKQNDLSKKAEDTNSNKENQPAGQSMDDTAQLSPLESIIAKDSAGVERFYTTLLDSKNRIVDTTDPELEKDNYYKSEEEGGKAGTVDLSAKLKVRFRMAEIIENNGNNGVQENVVYYSTLPDELVPVKKDSAGKELVDPEKPVTFFQSGEIECTGGIYSVQDKYQLQMRFAHVSDQLNIAGEFQYDVTLSDQLKEGEKCTVSYVPGGTLSFSITPKKEEPAEQDESISIAGQKNSEATDKIDWTLTLTDKDMKMSAKRLKVKLSKGSVFYSGPNGSAADDILGLSSVDITYKDGHTETLYTYRINATAFSLYRPSVAFDPAATDVKDAGHGILGTVYTDEKDYKSEGTILESGMGRFLTDTLYIDMAGLRSNASNAGNTHGSNTPADIDLEISKYEFKFTSYVYDNYNIAGNGYTATATMTDAEEKNTLATATAGTGISYGMLSSGILNDSISSDTNYFGIPSYVQSTYNIYGQGYTGNHYSLEFAPQQQYYGNNSYQYNNGTNAIYYTSNNGFFEGNHNIAGSNNSVFEQLQIGDASEWNFCAPLSYSTIRSGMNSQMSSFVSKDDLILVYQIQKVFENMDPDDSVLMYKSKNQVNGKYIYLFVDPDTRNNAKYSYAENHGWSRLASKSSDESDAKASNWKIHIFNAPAQSVSLSFKQSNGVAIANDQNTGGSATDTMISSYNIYGQNGSGPWTSATSGYGFARSAATSMTGRWVDEDTIFWEMTAYTENIPEWRASQIYLKIPYGQELLIGEPAFTYPYVDIDGKMVNTRTIQYYKDGSWNIFGGSKVLYNNRTGMSVTENGKGTTLTNDGTGRIYSLNYGSFSTYDGSHVKIGFFTKVTNMNSSSPLNCQAEIATENGETTKFGTSGASYYPFKISATGTTGTPQVHKRHSDSGHADADEEGIEHITDQWQITAAISGSTFSSQYSSMTGTVYKGFYSGTWNIHDDMKDSYTEDENQSKVDVQPAKYTTLKSIEITSKGPGISGKLFTLSEEDIKEVKESEQHTKTFTWPARSDVKLTLTYNGDMYDGFDMQVSGLNNITELNVDYTTDFNQKAFFDALGDSEIEKNQFFTAVLMNNAYRGSKNSTNYTSEKDTIRHRIVAALDINKSVDNPPKYDESNGGYSAQYTVDTQIGYTSSGYVNIEDYIMGYSEDKDKEGYTEADKEALQALAQALDLSGLTIKVKDVSGQEKQIYSGEANGETWTGSTKDDNWNVEFEYKPDTDHSGSLFQAHITKADGSEVPADTIFTITYKMTVQMDKSEGSFRESEWYEGGDLRIQNGAEAVRTVKELSGKPDTQSADTRAGKQEDLTLSADCGGGVTASFLSDKRVNKSAISTSDSDITKWMIYDWTGTKGKNHVTGDLTDALNYQIDELSYVDKETGNKITLDQLDDKTKAELIQYITGLLYKYTTFKNIQLYYTDYQPADDASNLINDDLLYTFGDQFCGKDASKTDEITVTDKKGKEHTIHLTTGDNQSESSIGFRVTADNLNADTYFAATYETEIDWDKIYEEIGDLYPECSIKTSYTNAVKNDKDAEKENVGSHVEVMEEYIEKSHTDSDLADGKDSWQIKAFTGPDKNGELRIDDEVNVNAQDERIKTAAEKSLSVDPDSVVVMYGDKIVYRNQKAEAGWKNDNIAVTVDGRKLSVIIKNTEDSKVIFANSTYLVKYNTVLDKDAYIANGGKAGDESELKNTAAMKHGSFSNTADSTGEFKPVNPISANKSYIGNGSDGQDKTTTLWKTVANTGDAGRRNFVMKDQVNCSPADEKVQNALKIQDMLIKVKTGQNEESEFTKENLPDGVTLTETGAGFTLTFARIPKNTTVTVEYAIHFDKDVYQSAGGESDIKVNLDNSFEVSTEDGEAATDNSSGSIEYGKGFTKEGKILSEKMPNGNPVVQWTMKVNLFDLYTAEDISKMNEVTVTDNLSPILNLLTDSIILTTKDGDAIDQDVYSVIQNGNELKVILSDPKSYPIFNLQFKTECGASVSGLINDASLSVDGKKTEDTSAEDVGKLEAANQYGWIHSMKIPEFTPVAYKYLDHELCKEKGLFQFSILQVDESGNPIENGYQDTATNDENGKITFKKITYRDKPVEGSYYYQIRETSEVKPYTYTIDERVFTIRVDVIASKGQYLVSYTVTDPENYDEVRFDNATVTTRDFTVTKKWNDDNDKAGARPKSITVYLLNNGKRYNNMSVTLNEENNWTYTWKDLPIADGDYSVEEEDVEGYNAEIKTKDWSSIITNTYKPGHPKDKEKPKKENSNSNSPRTGDNGTDRAVWWMLLALAALIVGLETYKTKNK